MKKDYLYILSALLHYMVLNAYHKRYIFLKQNQETVHLNCKDAIKKNDGYNVFVLKPNVALLVSRVTCTSLKK